MRFTSTEYQYIFADPVTRASSDEEVDSQQMLSRMECWMQFLFGRPSYYGASSSHLTHCSWLKFRRAATKEEEEEEKE